MPIAILRLLGLTWFTLGILVEKPLFFALSIATLALATAPHEIWRRVVTLRIELLVVVALIAAQILADSMLNALILVIYLMGLLNGLLLPDPRRIGPALWVPWCLMAYAIYAAYQAEWLAAWGLVPAESVFGVNTEEYELDPRSLSYAVLIALFYLAPHFAGAAHPLLLVPAMLAAAALGANKFGMAFAVLRGLPRALTAPLVGAALVALAVVGFGAVEATAARAALWADFAANFPRCDSIHAVCTELIVVNNQEGVRSFHSLALDFAWYGGPLGLAGALFFIWRAARLRSPFGRSAGILFALALVFGFPPFFNERHVLACYAFLVLFQEGRGARRADRPLRAHGAAPGGAERPALLSGR